MKVTNTVLESLNRYDFMDKPMLAAIATDPEYAYYYANEILKGSFEAGEAAIAKDPNLAFLYAKFVLKGPFPAGEAGIAKESQRAYEYAKDVLLPNGIKGFPSAEWLFAQIPDIASSYAKYVLQDPDWWTWARRVKEDHK